MFVMQSSAHFIKEEKNESEVRRKNVGKLQVEIEQKYNQETLSSA